MENINRTISVLKEHLVKVKFSEIPLLAYLQQHNPLFKKIIDAKYFDFLL